MRCLTNSALTLGIFAAATASLCRPVPRNRQLGAEGLESV